MTSSTPMKVKWLEPIRQVHPWVLIVIAIAVIGSGSGLWWLLRSRASEAVLDRYTVPVKVETLQEKVTASGSIVPIRTVNLSPKTAGLLVEVLVEQGQKVQQGQLIARMDNRELRAQQLQARAALAAAQAQLQVLRNGTRPEVLDQGREAIRQAQAAAQQAAARRALAQQELKRQEALVGEGAIARQAYDRALTDAAETDAALQQAIGRLREVERRQQELQNGARPEEVRQAEARVGEAIGRLQSVEVQLADTEIRAPFSGIITQRYADPGAFVTPTTSASATASATSTSIVALAEGLEVLAQVPEVDISRIRVGQSVQVRVDAFPTQTFEGKVRLVAPEAVEEQNVTSFQVRVTLQTGQNQLGSGMNADLDFIGRSLPQALVIPTVAIVTREGKSGVLIPDTAGKPEFRPVILGAAVGNETQILQGLQRDERIFIDLPPGQKWNPETSDR
ncbi:efflux RND transporter periplasmic adaptor subunit [Synechococcus elongatus]|uniref:efflux RND transporter periplasmic adaptor subunit n=1 Tax=Synechococcus elongatus TaxID=32046 RepID=UPI000F7DE7FC|nr:efflux RND transporter periplasmic adaptor subunit [Synechococcus elongatus]